MAFVLGQEEEDDKKEGASTGTVTQPSIITGGGQTDKAAPESKGSGRYTNLNTYLEANRPQAQQLSSNIASDVEKEGQTAREQLSGLASQYEKDISAPTQFINERFNERKAPPSIDEAKVTAQVAPSYDVSEEDIQKAANLRANKAQADKRIEQMEAYNPAMAQIEKAKQKASNLGSEEGRFAALGDYVKNRGIQNYGKGMSKMDQMLIQTDPTSAGRFKQAQESMADLQTKPQEEMKRLGDIQKQTQERIQQNLANIDAYSQAGQKAIIDPLTQQMTDFNKNMADQSEYDKQYRDYLTAQGYDPNTFGLDYKQYASFSPYRANSISEFANADQVAKMNALAKLAGGQQTALSDLNLGAALGKSEFSGADLTSPQARIDEFGRQIENLNQEKSREIQKVLDNIGNAPIPQYAYEQAIAQLRPQLQSEFDTQYSPLIQEEQNKINKYNTLINFLKGLK